MFPIILDMKALKVVLIGDGPATARRKQLLEDAGCAFTHFPCPPVPVEGLKGFDIVFIADLDEATTARIYKLAKAAGALVNAEDKKDYCDFHVPAIVRRGDLLLTVSTNAKSPRLARRIRQKLEAQFGPEWAERTEELGAKRREWLAQDIHFEELAKRTDAVLAEKGWL